MKKHIFTLIITILFCFSCNYKKKDKIATIIQKNEFYSLYEFDDSIKFPVSKVYKKFFEHQENSFCSNWLWLFENNTFESETGCENHSYRQYGHWEIEDDSLILKPFSKNKFNIFDKIEIKYNKKKEKFCFLKITNKNNEPISDFGVIGFDTSGVDVNTNKGYCFMSTNKKGILKIDKFKFDSISFITLDTISHKKIIFKNRKLPDSIFFKLNTVTNWICCLPTFDFNTSIIKYKIDKNKIKGW